MAKERKKLIYVDRPPEGLFYIPKFLTANEEQQIIAEAEAQPFAPYDHHGYKANREVVYFGTQGGYNGEGAEETAQAMPEWMLALRGRFAHLMGLDADEIVMGMIARYAPGAGIGWHRDRPQFGPTVMGVSLSTNAEMRFRRYVDDLEEMFKINLEHGSAYLMSGHARSVWQHGMVPVKELRYSITFRTLKDKQKDATDPRHRPKEIAKRLDSLGITYGITKEATVSSPRQLKLAL